MQNNNVNNANYTSCSTSPTDQQRSKLTRDMDGQITRENDGVENKFGKTKMYLNYFNVIQPVEKSPFSDSHLYSETDTRMSLNKTLSSNSISGTVDTKNTAPNSQKCYNKSSGNQVNRQPQFNSNYHKKYQKYKNNESARVKLNNTNHKTPFGYNHSQSGCINDSICTEPSNKHTLNLKTENAFTNSNLLNIEQNSEYDSVYDIDPGDLEKMKIMTAADFNNDRYARYGIHEGEIKDYVRTITFKNCIEYCSNGYIKDKIVLVIRCGIGLLPLLCARDGKAKKVIALEQSACIEYARRIVTDNVYSNKITLIQTSVHDLKQLPHRLRKVDVIVADFMGDCVISQGDQMEQVIEARDRFLVSNGLMIPMCVTLFAQLLEQRRVFKNCRLRKNLIKKPNKKLNFCVNTEAQYSSDPDSSLDSTVCSWWSDVYGFDMRSNSEMVVDSNSENADCPDSAKDEWYVMEEPLVTFFDPRKVVSDVCLIKEFDMYKCTIDEARHVHSKDLRLECSTPFASANGGDYAHMLELFMVVDFPNGQQMVNNKDSEQIGFSTSSFSPFTRFRQTGLMLRDQLFINEGDEFIINEFRMWRGPQQSQKNILDGEDAISNSTCNRFGQEEDLKIRLRYTFVNKCIKAINRRCAYTLVKQLF